MGAPSAAHDPPPTQQPRLATTGVRTGQLGPCPPARHPLWPPSATHGQSPPATTPPRRRRPCARANWPVCMCLMRRGAPSAAHLHFPLAIPPQRRCRLCAWANWPLRTCLMRRGGSLVITFLLLCLTIDHSVPLLLYCIVVTHNKIVFFTFSIIPMYWPLHMLLQSSGVPLNYEPDCTAHLSLTKLVNMYIRTPTMCRVCTISKISKFGNRLELNTLLANNQSRFCTMPKAANFVL